MCLVISLSVDTFIPFLTENVALGLYLAIKWATSIIVASLMVLMSSFRFPAVSVLVAAWIMLPLGLTAFVLRLWTFPLTNVGS